MRSWLTSIRLRLRALLNRRKVEQDVEDELTFHLAMKAEKLKDADAARRRFGNEVRIREDVRDAHGRSTGRKAYGSIFGTPRAQLPARLVLRQSPFCR